MKKTEIPQFHVARKAFDDSLKNYVQAVSMLETTCRALLSIDGMVNPAAAKQLREALDRLDQA